MNILRDMPVGPGRFRLILGDLTASDATAVVNAANPGLAGGAGVDGAIHRAAGPELPKACRKIIARRGPLAAGQAEATPGFAMAAKWIIHAVGPIWRGGAAGEAEALRAAYARCLELAAQLGAKTIAFPAISCGAYGFPVNLAAPIALCAIGQGLQYAQVARADLHVFSPDALATWEKATMDAFGGCE